MLESLMAIGEFVDLEQWWNDSWNAFKCHHKA